MKPAEFEQVADYLRVAKQSKYTYDAIKARFEGEPASSYGSTMSRWVPDYAYAHQLLLESIAVQAPAVKNIIELGAGSGRVSKMLLEAFPQAHLTMVDLSPNMLGEAERQLATYQQRCNFIVHDIFDAGLSFPPQSSDCVVSVFAVCHAHGEAVYRALYQRIYDWLKPNGYFVCYDHVLGGTFELTTLNALGWGRLLTQTFTQPEVEEAIVGTYQEDSPLTLSHHLTLMREVGFKAVDVLYKRDIFAMYVGVK